MSTTSRRRRTITALVGASALALASCGVTADSSSEDFPSDSIELVVPYDPGGGTDLVSRKAAEIAEKELGQTISIVNKPGGDSIPGMQEVAQSAPDGYTLITTATPLIAAQYTTGASLSPDSFDPVATINLDPPAIAVSADAPWQTAAEFIEAARVSPGNLSMGVTPPSGAWNVGARALEEQAGVDLNLVVFPEGAAPAVTALLGGQIDAVGVSPGEVYQHVRAGKLRLLAVGSDERLQALPDVPTYDEAGITEDYPGIGAFRVVSAPGGTPKEVLQTLERAFLAAAEDASYQHFLRKRAYGSMALGSEKTEAYLGEQDELYRRLLTG